MNNCFHNHGREVLVLIQCFLGGVGMLSQRLWGLSSCSSSLPQSKNRVCGRVSCDGLETMSWILLGSTPAAPCDPN